jgi:hypothetical protein
MITIEYGLTCTFAANALGQGAASKIDTKGTFSG